MVGATLVVVSAWMAVGAGAAASVATGDTCTATGSARAYTILITRGANAPEEAGFALGAPGANVTGISGLDGGAFSTQGLAANTTGAWWVTTPDPAWQIPGSTITMRIATSAGVTGPFTLVTTSPGRASYFDPILCAVAKPPATPSNAFAIGQTPGYSAASDGWRLPVRVAAAGSLTFAQQKPATAKRLVASGRVTTSKAGMAVLLVKPTAAGKATLKTGALKLKLAVQFWPKGGTPATKVVQLTLRR